MSHIETGQTKVSLSLLLKLAYALDMDLNFFLMDTPYVEKDRMIDSEIANKLSQCSPSTLLSVNKIIDVLLEQQEREKADAALSGRPDCFASVFLLSERDGAFDRRI